MLPEALDKVEVAEIRDIIRRCIQMKKHERYYCLFHCQGKKAESILKWEGGEGGDGSSFNTVD